MISSIEEMIAIVQIYIHHRKGKEVQIAITSARDIMLLTRAHSIALNWLNNNGFKQVNI
jgi:hypothetical protein